MVSRDDVILAYKLILGRSPENDVILHGAMGSVNNIGDLAHTMLNSPEFGRRSYAEKAFAYKSVSDLLRSRGIKC
jgi:hypothetical protein